MNDLFGRREPRAPLAEQLRPRALNEVVGHRRRESGAAHEHVDVAHAAGEEHGGQKSTLRSPRVNSVVCAGRLSSRP